MKYVDFIKKIGVYMCSYFSQCVSLGCKKIDKYCKNKLFPNLIYLFLILSISYRLVQCFNYFHMYRSKILEWLNNNFKYKYVQILEVQTRSLELGPRWISDSSCQRVPSGRIQLIFNRRWWRYGIQAGFEILLRTKENSIHCSRVAGGIFTRVLYFS